MFRQPVAPVAQPFGMAGKIERVGERLRDRAAIGNRREVKDGE
jgi:hypothetical protein